MSTDSNLRGKIRVIVCKVCEVCSLRNEHNFRWLIGFYANKKEDVMLSGGEKLVGRVDIFSKTLQHKHTCANRNNGLSHGSRIMAVK